MFLCKSLVYTTMLSVSVLHVASSFAMDGKVPLVFGPDMTRGICLENGTEQFPYVWHASPVYSVQQQDVSGQVDRIATHSWLHAVGMTNVAMSSALLVSNYFKTRISDKGRALVFAGLAGGLVAWQYAECMSGLQGSNLNAVMYNNIVTYLPYLVTGANIVIGASMGYIFKQDHPN